MTRHQRRGGSEDEKGAKPGSREGREKDETGEMGKLKAIHDIIQCVDSNLSTDQTVHTFGHIGLISLVGKYRVIN